MLPVYKVGLLSVNVESEQTNYLISTSRATRKNIINETKANFKSLTVFYIFRAFHSSVAQINCDIYTFPQIT